MKKYKLPSSLTKSGMPLVAIIEMANEHTLEVQAWLTSRTPTAIQFQGVGTLVSSGGLPFDLSNLVLGARYPKEVLDETIDAEINSIIKFFEERKVPWIWWLGPDTQPEDMLQRLAAHGLTGTSQLPAMAAALPAKKVSTNPDVLVWKAETRSDLETASDIRRIIFDFSQEILFSYFEDMETNWLQNDQARLYLARLKDGPPASIGALIYGNGYPGVYVMTTLPEWERKGLGSAILKRILADAEADGQSMVFLTASSKGFPLYRKFGFEQIFDYQEVWK